ncbi:MAG TPA: exonuclease domain-containing protein [Ferruginibacter sp.]|nr:exonuclease domain-containing protein [Ferruginibacter sp.]
MYAIVDIETTGGHASGNGITEIAIYIFDGEKLLDHFHSLINPFQKIPVYITALTGINDAMVAVAPGFEEVAGKVFHLLSNKVFVAHNVNFDYSFIKQQLNNCGYELNVKKLCTVRMGRKIFPGLPSYSLGNFCRNMGIIMQNRHRADADARATVELFCIMLLQDGAKGIISKMLKKTSAEQWLPTYLDKNVIDNLPARPGVYYFHDKKNKVIYVGKAINIKKRVSSHFTHNDTDKRRQHFLRFVASVSFTVCASELHALVLESTEIKRLWPKYNNSQKRPVQQFGLYSFEDAKGYLRLAIDRKKKNLKAHYQFNLLTEGNTLLRKMADEFELSYKLCFIDKSPMEQKDWDFLDAPKKYNNKVQAALTQLQIQLPSFILVDEGLNANEKLCMLVEKGSFWGMGFIQDNDQTQSLSALKDLLIPYADNDYIRNSIYAYVAIHPEKKIVVKPIAS